MNNLVKISQVLGKTFGLFFGSGFVTPVEATLRNYLNVRYMV